MNLPYSKFYWRDWQADTGLRACSLQARGLWVEMLAIMAQNDVRYGYLEIGGKMPSSGILARLIGAAETDVRSLMEELLNAGVPSIDGETWFSRRLVREGKLHDRNRRNGEKGGNPILKKEESKEPYTMSQSHSHGPTPPLTPGVNPPVKPWVNPPLNLPVNPDGTHAHQWKPLTDSASTADCLKFLMSGHVLFAKMGFPAQCQVSSLLDQYTDIERATACNRLIQDYAGDAEMKYAPARQLRYALEDVRNPRQQAASSKYDGIEVMQ